MAMSFAVGLVTIPVILFAFLLPIALLVALQVWLCKKSVRLGLILPGISLVLSMVLVFSMAAFGRIGGGALRVTDENGNIIQEETIKAPPIKAEEVVAVGLVFLVSNIPTVVFGGVWLHYKGRKDTLDDLKRMRIEDLE